MRNFIFIACAIVAGLTACGDKKTDARPDPEKAVLKLPEQNSICVTGNVISTTESTVTLSWSTAANADSYEVTVKDLKIGTLIKKSSTTNSLSLNLKRSTPYSWFVISKSEKSSASPQSDIWKFYNAGPSVESYSPFPAELIAPFNGYNYILANNIKLTWKGSDVDNDIDSYDVYWGETEKPALHKENVKDMFLNVPVSPGVTYFWKIVTRDLTGNTSESQTYTFKVI